MKKILSFIFLFSFFINSFAQNNNPSLTYWYYRDRLKYFVIPGANQGESSVMDIRNRLLEEPVAGLYSTWGQEHLYFGEYLGTLATEYELLKISIPVNPLNLGSL